MKRITLEQSKMYIPMNEDFTNSEPTYFILTQDPEEPEWENVTYFTARRNNVYDGREGEGDSWVYVLANKTMPNLVKIGYTNRTPDKRAEQISRGTGVPIKFSVEFAFKCFNGEQLERELHKYLSPYRINTEREFFQLTVDEAKKTIELLGARYK
jgi:hypothetical protein